MFINAKLEGLVCVLTEEKISLAVSTSIAALLKHIAIKVVSSGHGEVSIAIFFIDFSMDDKDILKT